MEVKPKKDVGAQDQIREQDKQVKGAGGAPLREVTSHPRKDADSFAKVEGERHKYAPKQVHKDPAQVQGDADLVKVKELLKHNLKV